MKDLDGDGLTNSEELSLGSNPQSSNTDQDGINDYEEVMVYKTDPNEKDSDHDGISDAGEIILKSDPLNYDSDQTYKQELSEDSSVFSQINTADSPYSISISADAGGYIGESIKASVSKYSDFLSEDEIIRSIIDLDYYDDFKLNNLDISFNLKNINNPQDYMIFKYNLDANMLLPAETTYDGNKLILNDTEDGTYCIANIADMAQNYSMISEIENAEQSNLGAVYDQSKTERSINITYEMILDDKTCSMKSWDEISTALIDSTKLFENNNYKCNLKLVFTAYGYSVDISCDNSERLKVICDTAKNFNNEPSVNSINSAYIYYANMKATSGNDVWNDLSTYYSAVNVKTISSTPRFVFNSNSNIVGHNCGFTVGSSFCNVFSKEILIYNKMFRNVVSNNKSKEAAEKIYAVLTYSNVIKSLIPYRNSLFGKTLLKSVLSVNSNADTDGDRKSDTTEFNLSGQKKLKEITSKVSLFSKGLSQWQAYTKVDISEEVITPMKSDPTKEDSDGDGIVDAKDAEPNSSFIDKFDGCFDVGTNLHAVGTNAYKIWDLKNQSDERYHSKRPGDDGISSVDLSGIEIRARSQVIAVLGGMVHSVMFLQHFFGNTGDTLRYNPDSLINKTANGYKNYAENMNILRDLCESTVVDELYLNTNNYHLFKGCEFSVVGAKHRKEYDWWYSLGNASATMAVKCSKNGDTYSADVIYQILDFYDWDATSTDKGVTVSDSEMATLHAYGRAREFASVGEYNTTMSWKKGERMETNLK